MAIEIKSASPCSGGGHVHVVAVIDGEQKTITIEAESAVIDVPLSLDDEAKVKAAVRELVRTKSPDAKTPVGVDWAGVKTIATAEEVKP